MEARHRQQDSNVASCCGTVTSVLARQLGGPVRTVEKTTALREHQLDAVNDRGDTSRSSSLGSPVTDDLDSSDMASCRGAMAANTTVHCSDLTVSNFRPEDAGWAARTDVSFRHRADRLFYVDSAARLHGPTDWRDRVRVAGIRRQEARRRQQQQQQQQQQKQQRQIQQHQRQARIVVQHRKQDSGGLDTRLSDLERCLDQAMASIRRGRLFTSDGRSCAAGFGGGSSDSLAASTPGAVRRRFLLPISPSSLRAEQSYQHQHQQQRRRHQSAANVMELNSQRYQRQQQLRQAPPSFWGGGGNGAGGGYWRR